LSADVARLLLLNGLVFVFGLGLLPLLRIAQTWRELRCRWPIAYMVGIATLGAADATLELIHVPLGIVEVAVLAVAAALGGGLRLVDRSSRLHLSEGVPVTSLGRVDRISLATGVIALSLALALSAKATYAYTVRPLREYDGWAIWGTKARALYEFGGADTSVFANPYYDAPTHPLLLPSLEAIGFRALGAFDPVLLHVQLGALAVGFVGAAWVVLRPAADPLLAGTTILAIISAPAVFAQLGTNFADIPAAFFTSLGIAAIAGWLSTRADWLLVLGAIFLAAGALTKSEGLLFAAAALVALLALTCARRQQLLRAASVAAVVILAVLPWRLFVAAHDLQHPDYELSNLFDRSFLADTWYRVEPVTRQLLRELTNTGSWGLLVPLLGIGLAVSVLRRTFAPAVFAAAWLVLSFTGLVLIYWITVRPLTDNLFNTSNRTVATLLIGMGLVAPVLVGRRSREDAEARRHDLQ
jgi:hypothetical protein